MAINEARQTLDALQGKLAAATAREIELGDMRRRISFDANTGNAGARKTLDAANKDAALIGLEIENLRSAILEAKRRVAEAEREEEIAAARANAGQVQALGESLVERAHKIDAALAIVAEESSAFVGDITALNRLGVANPRVEQFTSLGERALATALMQTPLKIRHLGFGEKRTFTELAQGWSETVNRWANALLGKEAA